MTECEGMLLAVVGMSLVLLVPFIQVQWHAKTVGDEYWWFGMRRKGMKIKKYYAQQKIAGFFASRPCFGSDPVSDNKFETCNEVVASMCRHRLRCERAWVQKISTTKSVAELPGLLVHRHPSIRKAARDRLNKELEVRE